MKFNKGRKILFLTIAILIIFSVNPLYAQNQNQNFPDSPAQGTTQMNGNIRGTQVPNVAIQITEPQSGREVAFASHNTDNCSKYTDSCYLLSSFLDCTGLY